MWDLSFLPWLGALFLFVFLVAHLKRFLADPARRAAEEDALRRYAELHGGRFVPRDAGEPALHIELEGEAGEARFREGDRRRRFPRHVRVRLPIRGADDVRIVLAPPVSRHNRRVLMLHPSPLPSGYRELDDRYDVSAPSRHILDAALAEGTAELLVRLHTRLWIEVKKGRVEVRLAGNPGPELIRQAIGIAVALRARLQSALRPERRRF